MSPNQIIAEWMPVAFGGLFAPVCASVRVLALLTFGGSMCGVAIPWRYRVCFSMLMGGVAAGEVRGLKDSPALVMTSELALGAAIGVGVGALLQSLRLAGELIDDRLRLADASSDSLISDGEETGPCGRLLGSLAVLLVVFGGMDGEMPLLEGLLEGFRRVPAGEAVLVWDGWRGMVQVLDGSLEVALRTAAPVLAAVTIVDWCQALISRAAPMAAAQLAATAVKPLLGLAVLTATFGGACEALANAVRTCLGETAGMMGLAG